MKTRLQKLWWGTLHQLILTAALVMFPLALATERLGLPFGRLMHHALNKTTTAYENAA